MPRARARLLRLCAAATAALMGTQLGCESREILRYSETPPRDWDLAWLVPLDAQGRVQAETRRFDRQSAGVELEETVSGFVVVGLVLDAVPSRHRTRIDEARLGDASLKSFSANTQRLEPGVFQAQNGAWLEFELVADRPYFDLIGPRSFDLEETISSSISFGLAAHLPSKPGFCAPVIAEDLGARAVGSIEQWRSPHVGELYSLPDGNLVAAVDPDHTLTQRGAVVRIRPRGAIDTPDALVLPEPRLSGIMEEDVRQFLMRPSSSSPTHVGAIALTVESKAEEREQASRLYRLDLPLDGSWSQLPILELSTGAPAVSGTPLPALGVAESHQGDLMVVGGRDDEGSNPVTAYGFVAISPGTSSTISFGLYEVVVGGRPNGDILNRAVALPPASTAPNVSLFALGARGGEILIVAYDPTSRTLEVLDRYRPPRSLLAKAKVGYEFIHVYPRPGGYELWAVGYQSLLVRRTVDGRWQSITDLIRDQGLADLGSDACGPLGYPRGRELLNVARSGRSALLTVEFCSGALLLRFDENDEPLCVTAVLPPGESLLRSAYGFEALTPTESGYLLTRTAGLEVFFVPSEG